MKRDELPRRVTIVEVGPRDGLQNERGVVPTEAKLRYLDLLGAAGLPVIEATSFVSPKWVPQLADHAEVMARLARRGGVRYPVLVPNARGLENAVAAGVDAIAVFTGATENFTKRNINQSVEDSLASFAPLIRDAKARGMWVRGYLSVAFGCPYEGAVEPERVAVLLERLLGLGCDELSVGDTIGVADPLQVSAMCATLRRRVPLARVAMHFHDTRGTAIANVCAALEAGVTTFDAASGGLGGCPYAKGASGNLATEDLVYLLDRLGVESGVDLAKVALASAEIEATLGRPLPGRVYQACAAASTRTVA